MALVVLTEPKPVEAISTLLRRCAYFTIPLSIVLIRYFRNIGVNWDWHGNSVEWIGVATSKNTLGQLAVTGALCFIWERIRRRDSKDGRIIDYLFIIMSLYLLKGSDDALSMTSLSVFFVGFFIFISLSFMKVHTERIKPLFMLTFTIVLGIILTVIYHSLRPFSMNSFMGTVIQAMGRDMTLSGRTEIWSDVYAVASRSPVLGVGYGAFWIGRLANIPWTENLTWTLGQAHNGYVDIYLQLGLVGLCLLIALIFFTIPKIIKTFAIDFEYGRFRTTFFLVVLFVNITESTLLRSNHNMWFLFLLAALTVPYNSRNTVGIEKAVSELPDKLN
jgi:O-antigen ligase